MKDPALRAWHLAQEYRACRKKAMSEPRNATTKVALDRMLEILNELMLLKVSDGFIIDMMA